jgi:hypothetical protein
MTTPDRVPTSAVTTKDPVLLPQIASPDSRTIAGNPAKSNPPETGNPAVPPITPNSVVAVVILTHRLPPVLGALNTNRTKAIVPGVVLA